LKLLTLHADTTSSGSEFHSLSVLGLHYVSACTKTENEMFTLFFAVMYRRSI